MFNPYSIQGLLERKNSVPEESELLQDINDTLKDLCDWREREKQKNEDFHRKLRNTVYTPPAVTEETALPPCTPYQVSYQKTHIQTSAFTVREPTVPRAGQVTAIAVDNSQLYEAGSKLNQLLTDWTTELDEVAVRGPAPQVQQHWGVVDEIEEELQALEDIMSSIPSYRD